MRLRRQDAPTIGVFTYGGLEGGNPLFAHAHFGGRYVSGGVSLFVCGGSSTVPSTNPNLVLVGLC